MPASDPECAEKDDKEASPDAADCLHRTLVLEQSGEYLTGQYLCPDCGQRFIPHF